MECYDVYHELQARFYCEERGIFSLQMIQNKQEVSSLRIYGSMYPIACLILNQGRERSPVSYGNFEYVCYNLWRICC